MPLYEFKCPQGHLTEEWWHLATEARHEIACPSCQLMARRIASVPIFHSPDIDRKTGRQIFKGDPFEGTPLEGTDGVNPIQYDNDIRTGKKEKKIWMKV